LTEPGNENGKTPTKEFKIFRTGSPEEWILWRRDFNEICTDMAMTTGSNRNRMVCQALSDEPLSQFETRLATHATETNADCNLALDAVAIQTFPNDACPKQKKHSRQGVWKPRALAVQNAHIRLCELNNQLQSHPCQTGALPEDKLKSAFINVCLPKWQLEFLKADINEHASAWVETISKAEALETAELALAEQAPAKRNIKLGEITPTSKLPPKKKVKKEEKSPFWPVANCMALDRAMMLLDVKSHQWPNRQIKSRQRRSTILLSKQRCKQQSTIQMELDRSQTCTGFVFD
jgi:hypothetical protein